MTSVSEPRSGGFVSLEGMRTRILLALLCTTALAGCGGGGQPTPNPTPAATTTSHATPAAQGVVLGEHGFVTGGVRSGWGSAHPVQIDMGGDPALVIHKIHWRGWGSRHAQGIGSAVAFNLHGGSWYPKPVRVELQAYELGRCEKSGPHAYRNLRLRMPPRPGAPMGQWFVLGGGANGLCRHG
jgi:hypothetical protein